MLEPTYKRSGLIRIGITQGELSGIAPEIIATALQEFNDDKTLMISVVASKEGTLKIKEELKITLGRHISFIEPRADQIPEKIVDSDTLSCIFYAAKLAVDNELDAIVTAPIDKNKLAQKYSNFSGHTGFLKHILKSQDVLMLMSAPSIKIGIMTEHIPLSEVPENITKERIVESVTLMHNYLSTTKTDPRIGVLALNPHAGDSGLVGTEELTAIAPAIKYLNSINIKAIGPIPADSAFTYSAKDNYDGIMAMYHDQGMIPAKIKGVDSLVNITLGLPIIRTSPGHGVAYDIAGTGTASASSMIKAINTAIEMVLAKRI